MTELYSSSSESYQTYLSQRQTDEIKNQISSESNKQIFVNMINTGIMSQKLDNVENSIERMSTGIQTRLQDNTYAVVASANMLQNTFESGFDSINNTLDLGFAGVSNQIGVMSAGMSAGFDMFAKKMQYWGTEICEKLDAIHDIVNNPLLTASRELYRRACQNTTNKFYEEALEDIKGAIEKNKTDYISWGLMGKIYLFGISNFSNVVDVPKAAEAFTNACKYITPDINTSEEAKLMASEFYFYLAFADYIISNESRIAGQSENVTKYLQDSVQFNAKSYALSDTMNEALYNQARSNCLLGNISEALKLCKQAVEKDGFYSLKASTDYDLLPIQKELFDYLNSTRDVYYKELQNLVNHLENDYIYFLESSTYANTIPNQIESWKAVDPKIPYLDMRNTFGEIKNLLANIDNADIPLDRRSNHYIAAKEERHTFCPRVIIPADGIYSFKEVDIYSTYEEMEMFFDKKFCYLPFRDDLMKKSQIINDHIYINFYITYCANEVFCESQSFYTRNTTQTPEPLALHRKSNTYRQITAEEVYDEERHMKTVSWKPKKDARIDFTVFDEWLLDPSEEKSFERVLVEIFRPGILKKEVFSKECEEQKIINEECEAEKIRRERKKEEEKLRREKWKQEQKKSGCYVATCVYGSYDCPQVWTLRRYRDNQLAKTWYGRAFIHSYYSISPTLVKWFGQTKWFVKMWKPMLDKMVMKLQSQGIEATPYNDKVWR